MAPSTYDSSSTLSIHLHRPTSEMLAFVAIFSPQFVHYTIMYVTTCPKHLSFDFLGDLQVGRMRGVIHMQQSSVAIVFKCLDAFHWNFVEDS